MACEPKKSRIILPGVAAGRIIYAGKGPTLSEAADHLDWGDLACVNDAGANAALAGRYSQVTFIDGARAQAHDLPQTDTGLIVSPVLPDVADAGNVIVDLWQWTHRSHLDRFNVTRAIEMRSPTYIGAPGPSGVLLLWLMGYTDIWLFGHDGGHGTAAGIFDNGFDYQNRRDAIEVMVPLLAERGCEVKFWPEEF